MEQVEKVEQVDEDSDEVRIDFDFICINSIFGENLPWNFIEIQKI